ncbi:MAG: hypothetical protein H0W50_06060 [Parachlamydiaceae bacterium]|nr:hypothetical protein [Parachlamydiaceae bacterium]
MDKSTSSKATTKLFAGFFLSSELKMHLNSSHEWKSLTVTPVDSQEFREIHYDNKKYVGHYLPEEKLTLAEIKAYELQMTQKLLTYCPKLTSTHLKFSLLAQLFIH